MSYAKIYADILTSSICEEDVTTRWLWVVLLIRCNRYGQVASTIPGLARLANLSLKDTERAMLRLLSPDPDSTTPDEDGRRVVEVSANLWHVTNYLKYRNMKDPELEREQVAARVRKHRRAKKAATAVTESNADVTESNAIAAVAVAVAVESPTESCPEPAEEPPPSEPPLLSFPCAKNGTQWHLTASKAAEYQETFPHLDILATLRVARQWCIDNPAKRKTSRGMPGFCSRWLAREQNARGGTSGPTRPETENERMLRELSWDRT